MGLIENVKKSIDGMGQVELSGIKLESANVNLLNVDSLNLDQHVAMQPSAIAYYGAMKMEANRRLVMLKRSYDRWEKKQWALAKAAVLSGTTAQWKPTLADIEARFISDNEPEIEEREKRLDKAQEEADTLDSWYEAWRQKSFTLRDHVSIDEDERYNTESSIVGHGSSAKTGNQNVKPLSSEKIDEVREFMKKRRIGN